MSVLHTTRKMDTLKKAFRGQDEDDEQGIVAQVSNTSITLCTEHVRRQSTRSCRRFQACVRTRQRVESGSMFVDHHSFYDG